MLHYDVGDGEGDGDHAGRAQWEAQRRAWQAQLEAMQEQNPETVAKVCKAHRALYDEGGDEMQLCNTCSNGHEPSSS